MKKEIESFAAGELNYPPSRVGSAICLPASAEAARSGRLTVSSASAKGRSLFLASRTPLHAPHRGGTPLRIP